MAMRPKPGSAAPDLFVSSGATGQLPPASQTVEAAPPPRRPIAGYVLPGDLPAALARLSDPDFDRLVEAVTKEASRRGRSGEEPEPAPRHVAHAAKVRAVQKSHSNLLEQPSPDQTAGEVRSSLTRGQLSAVRASFKAGIKPSVIARQFGLSLSDVRRALAGDTRLRKSHL